MVKCRAKHVHAMDKNQKLDTWITGIPVGEDYILTSFKDGHKAELLIDPATFGLCTGKQDRDGEEIYQGDVYENKNGTRFEVRFGTYVMYCPVDDAMMENIGFYTVSDGIYEDMPLGPTEDYAKVIGNIHDNPEFKVDEKYRCPAATTGKWEEEKDE